MLVTRKKKRNTPKHTASCHADRLPAFWGTPLVWLMPANSAKGNKIRLSKDAQRMRAMQMLLLGALGRCAVNMSALRGTAHLTFNQKQTVNEARGWISAIHVSRLACGMWHVAWKPRLNSFIAHGHGHWQPETAHFAFVPTPLIAVAVAGRLGVAMDCIQQLFTLAYGGQATESPCSRLLFYLSSHRTAAKSKQKHNFTTRKLQPGCQVEGAQCNEHDDNDNDSESAADADTDADENADWVGEAEAEKPMASSCWLGCWWAASQTGMTVK